MEEENMIPENLLIYVLSKALRSRQLPDILHSKMEWQREKINHHEHGQEYAYNKKFSKDYWDEAVACFFYYGIHVDFM
jgi:hypothetical protein